MTNSSINAERVRAFSRSLDALTESASHLRVAGLAFDEAGQLAGTQAVAEVRKSVERARDLIFTATAELVDQTCRGKSDSMLGALLDDLWGSADIVITAHAVLGLPELPSGLGVTCCPVRGALAVAADRVSDVAGKLAKRMRKSALPAGIEPVAADGEAFERRAGLVTDERAPMVEAMRIASALAAGRGLRLVVDNTRRDQA